MTAPPLVSIVTPVLNGARFLADNLASVRAQDHARVEHIVVDGGSTDGTLEMLRAAPGVSFTSEPDGGMYDAIGRGLRQAQGEIVAYQNADDRYLPGALSAAVACFRENPAADVVYGDYRFIDAAGRRLAKRPWRVSPFDARELGHGNFIPPQSTFLRRRVLDEGFYPDPALQYPGDWDWYVRLARAGKQFVHVDAVLSEFRLHEGSKTRNVGLATKLSEWRGICRRNGISYPSLLWHALFWVPLKRRLGLVSG
jgi:glycosyltransferase involved in cell wall biosynthesis